MSRTRISTTVDGDLLTARPGAPARSDRLIGPRGGSGRAAGRPAPRGGRPGLPRGVRARPVRRARRLGRSRVVRGGGRPGVSQHPRHGEIWWCELPDVGRRPSCVLSRGEAVRRRGERWSRPARRTSAGCPARCGSSPARTRCRGRASPASTRWSRSRRACLVQRLGRARARAHALDLHGAGRRGRLPLTSLCRLGTIGCSPPDDRGGRMPSPRVLKLADQIKEIVAAMLERRIKDPRLGFVTVTDVRLTGDSRDASVFYTVLGGDADYASTAAALQSATGLIRSQVGKQLGLQFTPTLVFIPDVVPESARQLDEALAAAREADARVAQAARARRTRGRPTPTSTTSPRTTSRARRADATSPTARGRPRTRPASCPLTRGPRSRRGSSSSTRPPGSPRTGWSGGSAGCSAPARSGTPARSTRWRPGCSWSGSSGPPGCSATSR